LIQDQKKRILNWLPLTQQKAIGSIDKWVKSIVNHNHGVAQYHVERLDDWPKLFKPHEGLDPQSDPWLFDRFLTNSQVADERFMKEEKRKIVRWFSFAHAVPGQEEHRMVQYHAYRNDQGRPRDVYIDENGEEYYFYVKEPN